MLKISHKEYSFFTFYVKINCSISNNSLYYSFFLKKGTYCSGDKICTEQHGVHHNGQLHILFTTVKCLLSTCFLNQVQKILFLSHNSVLGQSENSNEQISQSAPYKCNTSAGHHVMSTVSYAPLYNRKKGDNCKGMI